MSDQQTIQVYDDQASRYAEMTDDDLRRDPRLERFIQACPPGGRVLDLGCGPGTATGRMAQSGLRVDAIDASAEMVTMARAHVGVKAWQASFDEVAALQHYDGVWANFSLLHAPRDAVPGHLAQLHRALVAGGVFHIAVKLGTGAQRDSIGRLYTYFEEAELAALLEDAGFEIDERHHGAGPGLSGEVSQWLSLLARA